VSSSRYDRQGRNCPYRSTNVYGAAGGSGYHRWSPSKSERACELVCWVMLQVSMLRLMFVGWLILILVQLKMLGLNLYALIIGHKSCNMLSILNKLKLQTKLQNLVTNNVFWTKSKNTTTIKQKIKHKNPLPEPGIEHGTSCTPSGCVTTTPPSQLNVSIVDKLFNCFDAMGRNVNKQSRICGPHIFNKFIVSVIFLHAWITIFGSSSY